MHPIPARNTQPQQAGIITTRPLVVGFSEPNGWFYTTVDGKQFKLSQDKDEADREFHALLANREKKEESKLVRISLRKLCDEFLEWTQRNAETRLTSGGSVCRVTFS